MSRTPIHPGEILKDELYKFSVSAAELARQFLDEPAKELRVAQSRKGAWRGD